MRLATIWTLPGATFAERMRRTADWGAQKVAAHLPKRVRYWVFVQQGSAAMLDDEVVPEVRYMDLLVRIPA